MYLYHMKSQHIGLATNMGSERNKLYFQAIRFMPDLVNSIERIRSNSRLFRVIRD